MGPLLTAPRGAAGPASTATAPARQVRSFQWCKACPPVSVVEVESAGAFGGDRSHGCVARIAVRRHIGAVVVWREAALKTRGISIEHPHEHDHHQSRREAFGTAIVRRHRLPYAYLRRPGALSLY